MAHEDDNIEDMQKAETEPAEDAPAKLKVAWADQEKSFLDDKGTLFDASSGTVTDLPLKPKFDEEGSTTAAVRCENSFSATRVTTNVTSEETVTGPSSVAIAPIGITRLGQTPLEREPASDIFSKSQQQGGIISSDVKNEEEQHQEQTATTSKMGSMADYVASPNEVTAVCEVRMGEVEEEKDTPSPLKEVRSCFPTTTGSVLLPPSLRVDSIDEVLIERSHTEDAGDFHLPMLTLSTGFNDDDDSDDGIILPPSYSNVSVNSGSNISPSNHNDTGKAAAASQLLNLPIDSLHCVASFLTPIEWALYGQTCTAASKVCREVFRRVRMHGFRCATEVVTAWKLKQVADAKELAALYISAGVPIYPFSLGHSYHTLCWRMGLELKKLQDSVTAEDDRANSTDRSVDENVNAVDPYYNERNSRARDISNSMYSYLEDKALFFNPSQAKPASPASGRWGSTGSLSTTNRDPLALPPAGPNGPAGVVAAGGRAQIPPVVRPPDSRHFANGSPVSSPSSSPARSLSHSEIRTKTKASVPVPIHRHLLDQHLLGRSCVDDENGDMLAVPVSLSADFFHPHLSGHSVSTRSRSLSLQTPPSPRPFAVTGSGDGAPDNNLLQDPAFQAWAARAAATVHSTLGGAAADDAEELAELQDLYAQIFAVDRNGPAAPAESENEARNPPAAHPRAQPPSMAHGNLQRFMASVSLDDASLSTAFRWQGQRTSILSDVDLEVYSAFGPSAKDKAGSISELMRHLQTRFTFYQRRLEVILLHGDSSGHEECILDFWDEFFPLSAKIHYYDRHTAVPRISSLQQFLTQPCPKEIGIVQCEIERVKVSSKKRKGVSMKGRLFPTYEYRLFIKDRQHGKAAGEVADSPFNEDNGIRRDTVLMVAKNRGRKHVDTPGVVSLTPAAKKGANNYYLYTPQQTDVDTHSNAINNTNEDVTGNNNGVSLSTSRSSMSSPPMLLGRLQSNFIGTEFQIYTPKLRKSLPCKQLRRCTSLNESRLNYDEDMDNESGEASDAGFSGRRLSRFGRLKLRRSSSQAANSDQSLVSSVSTRSRSRCQKENSNVGGLRVNRRAIANASEVTPENGNETPISQEPFLCEEEDGVITYTANLLGSRPRIMDVCIPKISQEGNAGAEWRNYLENNVNVDDCAPYNRMLQCFKQLQQRLEDRNDGDQNVQDDANNDFGLLALQNRPPWWNIELGSFVLNFRGRVSVASVKNFQLCDRNDHDHIMLQFGRIQGRHSFTMDYQYPLTAVQAFSIAISSLQSKISFG